MSDPLDDAVELYPGWRRAIEEFKRSGMTFNDLLTHDTLYGWMGMVRPDKTTPHGIAKRAEIAFFSQFDLFRDALLTEMKIDLRNERGRGWVLVHPDDQSTLAVQDLEKENTKSVRKAMKRATNVQTDCITSHEKRRAHADNVARIGVYGSFLRRVWAFPKLSEKKTS